MLYFQQQQQKNTIVQSNIITSVRKIFLSCFRSFYLPHSIYFKYGVSAKVSKILEHPRDEGTYVILRSTGSNILHSLTFIGEKKSG